jgi:TPR repeat protein
MALTDLHGGFRDEHQRQKVSQLILDRFGDERKQDELHSLLKFSSQLSATQEHIDEADLADTLSADKLAAVEALIRAVRTSHNAVDAWIRMTSRSSPLLAPEPRLEIRPPASVPDCASLPQAQAEFDEGADGAAFRLAELLEHEGDRRRAAAMYRLISEAGDADALYALGRVYWVQDEYERSQAGDQFWLPAWRITEVWQHAADLGSVEAMHAVAMMADSGSGMALRYLRQAAALNHPPSCYALGYYAAQRGDREEALAWWTRAAESGYQPAAEAIPLLDVYRAHVDNGLS